RYARGHGPFTTADVARRYGLGQAVVTGALRRLAAQGRISEGEFLPGGRGAEWCDAEVLRLLRRGRPAPVPQGGRPPPPRGPGAVPPGWPDARPRAGGGRGARARPGRRGGRRRA